jgi:hypothetical protein
MPSDWLPRYVDEIPIRNSSWLPVRICLHRAPALQCQLGFLSSGATSWRAIVGHWLSRDRRRVALITTTFWAKVEISLKIVFE